MYFRSQALLSALGSVSEQEFDWMEGFLEGAKAEWNKEEFTKELENYFDRVISLMRASSKLDDLR